MASFIILIVAWIVLIAAISARFSRRINRRWLMIMGAAGVIGLGAGFILLRDPLPLFILCVMVAGIYAGIGWSARGILAHDFPKLIGGLKGLIKKRS